MELFEAIRTRRSIRRFSDRPLEDDKVDILLEAIRQAPSWANMQCWRFVVVKDPSVRMKISELTYVESFFAPLGYKSNPAKKGVAEAPIVFVACADPAQSGRLRAQDYYLADMGIACQNLMLAARGLGLGSVFVGVFDEEAVRALLDIPEDIRIVGIIPVGYPREEKKEGPSRKSMEEIVFHERWKV